MDRTRVVEFLRQLSVEEMRTVLSEVESAWDARIILHLPCRGCQQVVFGPHACPGPSAPAHAAAVSRLQRP